MKKQTRLKDLQFCISLYHSGYPRDKKSWNNSDSKFYAALFLHLINNKRLIMPNFKFIGPSVPEK